MSEPSAGLLSALALAALAGAARPAPGAATEPEGPAPARQLRVVGAGKKAGLDVAAFPAEQKQRYELFAARCSRCHALARPIQAVVSGVTPVSKSPFTEEYLKTYVVQMMRKPNSGISKDDAREIILLLRWFLTLRAADVAAFGEPT